MRAAFIVLPLLALVACARGDAAAPPAARAPARPVLVELFTSQGCSSCPPADRLVADLAAQPPGERAVVPLAFHVDYWNYIGWQDPFSSADWTARQRRYGTGFPVEARDEIRLGDWQNLDRDTAAQPRVGRFVDLAHAAHAERRHDLVRTEAIAGGQAHDRSGADYS